MAWRGLTLAEFCGLAHHVGPLEEFNVLNGTHPSFDTAPDGMRWQYGGEQSHTSEHTGAIRQGDEKGRGFCAVCPIVAKVRVGGNPNLLHHFDQCDFHEQQILRVFCHPSLQA